MIFTSETYELHGRKILLRSATEEDAEVLMDYLKTVSGETCFLRCDPDEIHHTKEQEIAYIKGHNESPDKLLLLAFVDGEYAGNCSFEPVANIRREKHRAEIGIALFLRFTGFGLGRLMMNRLLEKAKEQEFEQAELTVVGGNDRAYHLYESLGFRECGRIPHANRYQDGTYRDNILMVLPLR